jgi:galactokinase
MLTAILTLVRSGRVVIVVLDTGTRRARQPGYRRRECEAAAAARRARCATPGLTPARARPASQTARAGRHVVIGERRTLAAADALRAGDAAAVGAARESHRSMQEDPTCQRGARRIVRPRTRRPGLRRAATGGSFAGRRRAVERWR